MPCIGFNGGKNHHQGYADNGENGPGHMGDGIHGLSENFCTGTHGQQINCILLN